MVSFFIVDSFMVYISPYFSVKTGAEVARPVAILLSFFVMLNIKISDWIYILVGRIMSPSKRNQ